MMLNSLPSYSRSRQTNTCSKGCTNRVTDVVGSYWQSKQTLTSSEGCAQRFTAVGLGLSLRPEPFLNLSSPLTCPGRSTDLDVLVCRVWIKCLNPPGSSKRSNSVTVANSRTLCFAASGKQQTHHCAVTIALDIPDAARTN